MREATELRDDRPMPLGKFKRLLPGQVLFQSGEQQHAEFLVGEILAVLERHVEELPLHRRHHDIEAAVDGATRDAAGLCVAGTGERGIADDVARELVEHDRKRGVSEKSRYERVDLGGSLRLDKKE